jgi:hypothetical protein
MVIIDKLLKKDIPIQIIEYIAQAVAYQWVYTNYFRTHFEYYIDCLHTT